MAITKPNAVLYSATEMPWASSWGLDPVGDCEPKISIMPTTVPNKPISGLIVAIPSMIFYRHFRAKVDALVVEMEQQAIKLVELAHGERK